MKVDNKRDFLRGTRKKILDSTNFCMNVLSVNTV